ncbi:unnamed protein product [Cyprideis torosa]|uniref:Golgi SNAP receptor complex member 1 n=1 Tax=Cyprideis torosa TaxID=163714 RepID=A0A7R8ZMH6_9CRUS|nr:unnamed protein product [Cyprideis torosa]CAG0888810.1 unnamed protein product [Cyprideis torosa]
MSASIDGKAAGDSSFKNGLLQISDLLSTVDPFTEEEMAWEDLRKQARQLENELDIKLVAFSKLGASKIKSKSQDTVPLLRNSSDDATNIASMEIEGLLAKLSQLNDAMSDYSSSQASNPSLLHTIQRHREILQDYTSEFLRTKKNIQSQRDREALLGGVSDSSNRSRSMNNRRTDLYLKENDHLRNSERLIDEQISIAMETREGLTSQKATFKAIQTRMNDMVSRFPMINSLVQKVKLKKRRDAIVVGVVAGVCLVLLLMYAFRG